MKTIERICFWEWKLILWRINFLRVLNHKVTLDLLLPFFTLDCSRHSHSQARATTHTYTRTAVASTYTLTGTDLNRKSHRPFWHEGYYRTYTDAHILAYVVCWCWCWCWFAPQRGLVDKVTERWQIFYSGICTACAANHPPPTTHLPPTTSHPHFPAKSNNNMAATCCGCTWVDLPVLFSFSLPVYFPCYHVYSVCLSVTLCIFNKVLYFVFTF